MRCLYTLISPYSSTFDRQSGPRAPCLRAPVSGFSLSNISLDPVSSVVGLLRHLWGKSVSACGTFPTNMRSSRSVTAMVSISGVGVKVPEASR
jgi:hypothetical protein